MKHKQVPLAGIKTSGLAEGEFIGYASTFGNTDIQGDRVMPGAFAKSLDAMASGGQVTPILWMHRATDPKAFVGEIKSARETDEGLEIHAALDTDTPEGAAAYKAVKARRITTLSIGYATRDAVKASDGVQELRDLDLMEVSLVLRPANDRAVITASKSGDNAEDKSVIVIARKALAAVSGKASEFVAADETEDDNETDPADDTDQSLGDRFLALLERATEEAQALISAAEDEGRDLSPEEAGQVAKALRAAHGWKSEVEKWGDMTPSQRWGLQFAHDVMGGKCSGDEFRAKFGDDQETATGFQTFDATGVGIHTKTRKTKSHKEIPTVETTKYLPLGSGRKAAAQAITAKMTGQTALHDGGVGTKALTSSGQVVTDIPVMPGVIATGRPAVSILDVVPTERRTAPTYRFIRQASRALAAAAVAEGDEKPVSAMGTQTIDNTVSVIAHLSEPIDKFVLADAGQLVKFVTDEMLYGLDVAVQAQVLNGTGTGANQTGLLNTSGIQVQAFATNVLTSVRKAITAQEALGYAPSVLVIRPDDWEALELLATTDAALSYRGVPLDQGERRIWGLRAVLSTALPAKTALVLDPNAVSVDTVGGIDVEWSTESGELFARNQVQLRVEGRFGVSVYQPSAVVKVATQAA
ncbi:HK97 family phage prohead protease [Gordonia sp. ABSL11-1]|uniref:HK97 family phage prohead protease n=1 Tax=Gordonia sp. ABSL11-1 TaxID=3053924 RepID=UPI002572E98C|nr:HK97 family phage prohead protease [Gordonia sp. ABSL11-1]MDL9944979.1 HK97 family phage prohead protease [Gordonia sp. ABSL11-1]